MDFLVQTVLARFVFICASGLAGVWVLCAPVAAAQSTHPTRLEVVSAEKAIRANERTSVVVRLVDSQGQPVPASKNFAIEILRRLSSKERKTIATAMLRKGESMVEVPLPALDQTGLVYLWARNPELALGGAYLRVRQAKSKAGVVRRFPAAAAPPSASYQLALRYSPERPFLANGKDPVTIHAFVMSDNESAIPGFRLNLYDGSGTLTPKPLEIPPNAAEATATLTYDHVGTVKVQFIGSTPPASIDGDRELAIQFEPPITGVALSVSPAHVSLVDSPDLVATLIDDNGKPIATREPRVLSLARASGRGEIEKQELTIAAGASEARTKFIPTWWGQTTILASTPNLLQVSSNVEVFMPIALLVISLVGGLAGAFVYFLQTKDTPRWRIPVGALAGVVLLWAVLFLGLSGLPRSAVLNPFSVFVISLVGGWAGTKVFDMLLSRFDLAHE